MNFTKSIVLVFALMFSHVLIGQCGFSVSLGADTIVCAAKDSFKINAIVTPPGNYLYEWTEILSPPNINQISNIAIQAPFFNKDVSENKSFIFLLIVHDTISSCTMSDTIQIKVEKGYGMNLPKDTSICYDFFSDFNYHIDTALTAVSWHGWAEQQGATGNSLQVFHDSLYMDSLGLNHLLSSVFLYDSLTKCEVYDSIYVYIDSCLLTVWPGDANNDNIVNMLDIFPVGIGNDTNGPARSDHGNAWLGVQAIKWNKAFGNGYDYAFADCDGDGYINDHDIISIERNYTLTHNRYNPSIELPKFNQALPTLYCQFENDTVYDESQVDLKITLGDPNQFINNVFGVAFSLYFNPSYVVDSSFVIDFKHGLLGLNNYNIYYEHSSAGQLDIAIVNAGQKDTTGFGDITGIRFILEDVIAGSNLQSDSLSFSLGNVNIINMNYDTISVNVVSDTVEIIQSPLTDRYDNKLINNIKIFPNPANEMFFISRSNINDEKVSLRIYDLMGKLMISRQNIVSWPIKVKTSKWNSGVYIIDLQSKTSFAKKRRILN